METRETNSQLDSSNWVKTKEEKEKLIDKFIEVYKNDLTGNVNTQSYPDKESRIAEKHVALSIMRVLSEQDDLWIMPIGRLFPAPDKLPPEASQPMKNQDSFISRFQAVIAYNKNSGGMTVFDFGIAGCELQHSGKECMKRYKSLLYYGKAPSYLMTMALLEKATKDLASPIHKDLYAGDFSNIAAKAEEAAATTVENMGALGKLGLDKDITRIQSGFPSKGCELISLAPGTRLYNAMHKDEAYIRQGHSFSYSNKITNESKDFSLDAETLAKFDAVMGITQPTKKTTRQILSENQLEQIAIMTHHEKPLYKPQLVIGVLPILPEEKDLNLVFGPHTSPCRLAISNKALQPAAPAPASIPDYFCDPVTKKLLIDPVTIPNGQTYERKDIEEYIDQNHKDPLSGQPLERNQLVPNLNLKYALEKYNSSQSATATTNAKSSFFAPSDSMIVRGETDPEYLCCPITSEIMKHPMMTPSGKTFEGEAIEDWIKKKGTDPFAGSALTIQDLRPNNALKAVIQDREKVQPQQRPGFRL